MIAKITAWRVGSGGQLSATGSIAGRPLITAACDTRPEAGGDTGCPFGSPELQTANITVTGSAQIDLADAEVHRTVLLLDGSDDETAEGTVTRTTFTSSSIDAEPAALTWSGNTFDLTAMFARGGDSLEFVDNRITNASQVRIDDVDKPVLRGNRASNSVEAILVQHADDLSAVAPTNSATGSSEDMRRLRFDLSAVPSGKSMTVPAATVAIYGFASLDVQGALDVLPGAVIDVSGELDVEGGGGSLQASGATFRTLGDGDAAAIEAERGGSITITGSSIEGIVRGVCDPPGPGSVSVTGSTFSGAARFERCNTQSVGGGAKAVGTGNSGVLYTSHHFITCFYINPPPPPPAPVPPPYPRRVWDVATGMRDDPACIDGYREIVNTAPTY